MAHETKPTILLIEADRSLRRLIALGLQHRGMHIIEADSPTQVNIPPGYSPALLVLDIDSGVHSNWSLLDELDTQIEASTIPIVVLTWASLVPAGIDEEYREERITSLSKPFDARTLYATVERLLETHRFHETELVHELSTSSHPVTASLSIWPLLTAVGLLLAFIGMMGQLSLIIIGLSIVLVSLLWWTLGKKPERAALPV